MINGTPRSEHAIDEGLVQRLLAEQHPDLADVEIRLLDVGWDNAMYRLGEKYVARLPRRQMAATLIAHEQTWLPVLAPELPVSIPSPVRVGHPTSFYPWPWSIVPWLPGETADLAPPEASQVELLSAFLLSLHKPAPPHAPNNPLRGVPLRTRAKAVGERLDRLRSVPELNIPELRQVWSNAVEAPETQTACWLHGDLHARNVLVTSGQITGIIDWGDITSGDVATDLASVWMLFSEPEARRACLRRYQADSEIVARAKGWAVFFGSTLLETGLVDHPRHAEMGMVTLQRLAEDV